MAKVGDQTSPTPRPARSTSSRDAGPDQLHRQQPRRRGRRRRLVRLQTPAGTAYTRDGRFHLTDLGEMQSVNGYPVLDIGGSPMTIDPRPGRSSSARTATSARAASRSVRSAYSSSRRRQADAPRQLAVFSDIPPEPVEDTTDNSVRQGYIEGSNVNADRRDDRLIEVVARLRRGERGDSSRADTDAGPG